MNNQPPNASARILEFPRLEEPSLAEEPIKARLLRLTNLVEDFASSTINVLDVENNLLRELLEELVVKEAALRWIVRTASHSQGPVREKLWADIDKVLFELENTAETYGFYSKRGLNNPALSGMNQVGSGSNGQLAS